MKKQDNVSYIKSSKEIFKMAKSSWNKGTRVLLDAGDVTPIPKQPTVTSGDIVPPSPALDNFDGLKGISSAITVLLDDLRASGIVTNPKIKSELDKYLGDSVVTTPQRSYQDPDEPVSTTGTMLDAAPMPTDSYVIKSGDTMGKIAANNPFTLTQLIASNPQIEDPNKIEVGQQLNFPPVGVAKAGQIPTSTGTTNSMLEINDPQGEGDRPAISMSSFVSDYLKGHEGTKAHPSDEGGKDTQAYGVKFSLGLNKKTGESDADFAARVAEKHYDAAVKKFNTEGKVFRSLPQKAQAAILDLHYNVGNIGDGTAKASTVEGMLKNTLNFNVFTSNSQGKKVLASLVPRRAKNWNAAADELGLEKIAKVTVENIYRKENGKNVFDKSKTLYLDSKGNTIKEVINTKYPAVTVNKKSKKTTDLTTTKEWTF